MNPPSPLRALALLAVALSALFPARVSAASATPPPAVPAAASSPAAPAAALSGEWSLLSADAGGLRLAWTASGAESGPRTLAFAVPPGAAAAASVEWTSSPGGNLTVSSPARFRDLMIGVLAWDPGTGPAAPRQARFRVAFPARSGGPPWRAAFAPPESSPAEAGLRGWLANYAQSRNLRSAPAAPLAKAAADGPSPSAFLPARRLVIRTAGENIEFLPYDTLKALGVPLAAIDPREMRLYHDGVETPMYIEGEQDGRWNPGDYIEFIGKRAAGANSYRSFYADRAAFMLVWEGGRPGLRAPAAPVAARTGGPVPSFPADARPAPAFTARVHMEEDVDVLRIGGTSAEDVADLGSRVREGELTDFWMWRRLGAGKDQADMDLSLPFAPAAASGGGEEEAGNLRVTVNLKGITNNPNADPDHHLKFLLNGKDISLVGGTARDAIWEGQDSYTWVSPPLGAATLKAGRNTLTIQKVNDLKTADGQAVETQDAYVNYIEMEFPAAYRAVDGSLAFSNAFADSLGPTVFSLEGFPEPSISLWDKQGRKLTHFLVTRAGADYGVSFLDTLAGPTEFLACAESKRERPKAYLDTLDDLLDGNQGADYLVITESGMLGPGLDSLLEFRRRQGLRTRVVLARHIYQAFGDGTLDPAAIRRFVAYAYANWARPAPAYLLLAGDASVGFEKDGKTVVPFHPVNIPGWGVAANDDYFAKVSGDDDIADLYVGRFPAADRRQLSDMIRKTMRSEADRPFGHWNNKALLISGFEASFMAENQALQGIMAGNDRQYARIDLYPGSPRYRKTLPDFFARMDSAFNLVSFVGHGGGSVWSDAGVLTLKALDEGKLNAEYPIPLVSSITCLTGFFEDTYGRSLGEEMLRLPEGGAAGFYGAAGYISNLAGEALAAEVARAATGNAAAGNGAIVGQAETMVKLRTGDAFLPVLAEFNLLGDPAFGIPFPRREGNLELDPRVLDRSASLSFRAGGLAAPEGNAKVTFLLGDSAESELDATVAGAAVSGRRDFEGELPPIRNGKVILHYWNDRVSRVVSAPFATLDWMLDSVAIDPPDAAPGDSVRIRARLATAYERVAFRGGAAVWAVGGEEIPLYRPGNQVVLESADGAHLVSAARVRLDVPAGDQAAPKLHLAFRLLADRVDAGGETVSALPNLSSRDYALPLAELPRLELPPESIHLPIQDEPGVWVQVHNRGYGTAKGFRIALQADAAGPAPSADTLGFPGSLGLGGLDSVFFPLPDSMFLGKRLRASLLASREGDLAASGNVQDTVFEVWTAALGSEVDTLRLGNSGRYLTLSGSAPKPRRVFAREIRVASLPAHLAPAQGGLPLAAWRLEAADFVGAGFVVAAAGLPVGSSAGAPKRADDDAAGACWHFRAPGSGTWLKLDTLPAGAGAKAAAGFRSGDYALLVNRDAVPPLIQISSRGQILLDDDYVPLNTPIDVVLRDGQGIDLARHPPTLESRRQTLDSANHRLETGDGFPTLARLSFTPDRRIGKDSLVITAHDVSGNEATRTLAYRMGDRLAIRGLGSYPNPFADTAIFAYSLTDYCDRVDLRIYSRAGRPVRRLSQRNVVGYQEVAWDGRTDAGREVANGLYFLKVTAKSGSKEDSRIYKLFKKKRK